MKKLVYFSALILFGCQSAPQTTETPTETTTTEAPATITPEVKKEKASDSNLPTPTDISKISLDKINLADFKHQRDNQFGGGDCMGGIHEYAQQGRLLTIDSMGCGDYGLTVRYMLLENGALCRALIRKSSANMDEASAKKGRYTLTDEQFDFCAQPAKAESRKGYNDTPDLKPLKSSYAPITEPTPAEIKKELKGQYDEMWTLTIEEY